MQIPDTPRARLVDLCLRSETGEGLGDAIVRLRDEGRTWPQIADYLSVRSGVEIGREGLRLWARDMGLDTTHRTEDAA